MSRTIIDHILFNDELDMLLARLEILSPIVTEFRIYESGFTFQGEKKELHATNNQHLFMYMAPRVTIHAAIEPPHRNPWVNEERARNRFKIIQGAINIMSDVDEIPSRSLCEMVMHLPNSAFPVTNLQDFYYYDIYTKWIEPCACSVFAINTSSNYNRLRQKRKNHTKIYGGWHFSYFGGHDQIRRKLNSFSHTEVQINDSDLKDSIKNGFDFIKTGKRGKLIRLQENPDIPDYVIRAMAFNKVHLFGNNT